MTKYKKGNIITCNVTGIEKYGIFVSLDDDYSGLIHISEISYDYVNNINDYVKIGDTINAKVIDVDDENNHIKLSIKDIDQKSSSKNKVAIEEVGSGFGVLKDNLPNWIKEKTIEYSNNSNDKK